MSGDIRAEGWIARLPPGWRPYAVLARLDRPAGIWLLLLPALWAIALAATELHRFSFMPLRVAMLFAAGAVIMRAAGCVINDLWDRDIDARVGRTKARPLASGALSVAQALGFLCALLLGGFCILLLLNGATILLGLLVIPLIVIYPLMKRVTFWPQAVLGLTFNFGALMGWSAVTGQLALPALLLYAAGVFWTLGYDTVYAHQDREDDALAGVKSTALKFGAGSKKWVAGFYGAFWLFFALALAAAQAGVFAYPALAVLAGHLFWQLRLWDPEEPESALRVFRSNRDAGLIALSAAMLAHAG